MQILPLAGIPSIRVGVEMICEDVEIPDTFAADSCFAVDFQVVTFAGNSETVFSMIQASPPQV